jgi:hypothetical protein
MDDNSFFVGTKLDNLVSVRDTASVNLISLHVHNQLHAGLKGVQVLDLADYFRQKRGGNVSIIGSVTAVVKRLLGGKRSQDAGDIIESANKRRRVN